MVRFKPTAAASSVAASAAAMRRGAEPTERTVRLPRGYLGPLGLTLEPGIGRVSAKVAGFLPVDGQVGALQELGRPVGALD